MALFLLLLFLILLKHWCENHENENLKHFNILIFTFFLSLQSPAALKKARKSILCFLLVMLTIMMMMQHTHFINWAKCFSLLLFKCREHSGSFNLLIWNQKITTIGMTVHRKYSMKRAVGLGVVDRVKHLYVTA